MRVERAAQAEAAARASRAVRRAARFGVGVQGPGSSPGASATPSPPRASRGSRRGERGTERGTEPVEVITISPNSTQESAGSSASPPPSPPRADAQETGRLADAVEVIEILSSDDEGVRPRRRGVSAPAVPASAAPSPVVLAPVVEPVEKQCVICLGNLAYGDRVVTLPCMHVFHAACILPHLRSTPTPMCPNDRQPIDAVDVRNLPVWKWGGGASSPVVAAPVAVAPVAPSHAAAARAARSTGRSHTAGDEMADTLHRAVQALNRIHWEGRPVYQR